MRIEREIRLPLQVGTSSAFSGMLAAVTLVPSVAMLSALAVLYLPGQRATLDRLPGWMVALLLLSYAGVLLLPYAVSQLRRAIAERPSDVLLGPTGLRIEGGRYDGRFVEWTDIDVAQTTIERVERRGYRLLQIVLFVPTFLVNILIFGCFSIPIFVLDTFLLRGAIQRWDDRVFGAVLNRREYEVWTLTVVTRDGARTVVAQAERPIERDSLQALLDSIRGVAGPGREHAATGSTPPGGVELLFCPSCRAPAVPADEPHVRCAHCGANVPVSAELRRRIRSTIEVVRARKVTERDLVQLLDQPGARPVGRRMAMLLVPLMVSWPVAIGLALVLLFREMLVGRDAALLATFAIAWIVAVYFIARAGLVNRQALRILALEFGARPAAEGAGPTCRVCAAPLPEAPGAILSRCVYCAADNVLGLDLRREVTPAREQALTLEDAFRHRRRERRRWRVLTAAVVPLLAVAGMALVRGVRYLTDPGRFESDLCAGGDGARCANLAFHYGIGVGVPLDREREIVLYQVACRRGYAPGCKELGDRRLARGDRAGAVAAWVEACSRGAREGCLEAGRRYAVGSGVGEDGARAAALLGRVCGTWRWESEGCNDLAVLYAQGRGVPRDEQKAAALYLRACNGIADSLYGCTNLGEAYLRGNGVERDEAHSARLFRRACDGGFAIGCFNLALSYERGQGVARDQATAAALMQRACAANVEGACPEAERLRGETGVP